MKSTRSPATAALSGRAFATLLLVALMMGANHVAARLAFDHGVDVATAVTFRSADHRAGGRRAAVRLPGADAADRAPSQGAAGDRRAGGGAEPVPVLLGGAAAGRAGAAGLQHLSAVDRAVGARRLRTPARAARAACHAGDAARPGAGARRVRCRLGAGRRGAVEPDRQRRRLRARGGGHLRPGAGADAARSRRPRRPAAHLQHDGDRRRGRARRRRDPGRLRTAARRHPAGSACSR